MSLAAKLLSASGGGVDTPYVDDVFQAFTRTGTGADVTVTTGIDMTKGYMLWSKGRSGATDHAIYDSARGVTFDLTSNTTAAQTTQATGLKSVSATGHTIGSLGKMNTSGATYVDFVIRKAPKFFDVVTWTGNDTDGRQIPHSLGVAPGMVIIKAVNVDQHLLVYHRSMGDTSGYPKYMSLNTTGVAQDGYSFVFSSYATSTYFTVGSFGPLNSSPAGQFIAYVFAHDPSTDGIIQCGSYTGNGSATGPIVNLGWEPQYLMIKNASGTGNWQIIDSMRGMPVGSSDATLQANLSNAESSVDYISPTATGFNIVTINSAFNTSAGSYIYLAIRRPNKPPTTGTEVYNAIARTGTSAAATVTGVGFAPDLAIGIDRAKAASFRNTFEDRLRGAKQVLISDNTYAEAAIATSLTAFGMDGVTLGTDNYYNGASPYINHFFKRAPGVFDEVCDTGTGAAHTVSHGLGVVPELMIRKKRSATDPWYVYAGDATDYLVLNTTAATADLDAIWNDTAPTSSVFTVGTNDDVNQSAGTFVTYLFATKAGISKVGSYVGNGSNQTINCGFTTGARFILIKRTDAVGDWYVWDTTRGIVAGNDPHLSLNSIAAEVGSDDSIDPDTSGFIVNQLTATNINVNGAGYIYLAFA